MRTTRTYVEAPVSPDTYLEVRKLLVAAGYDHAIHKEDGSEVLDMHGLALTAEPDTPPPPSRTIQTAGMREAIRTYARDARCVGRAEAKANLLAKVPLEDLLELAYIGTGHVGGNVPVLSAPAPIEREGQR